MGSSSLLVSNSNRNRSLQAHIDLENHKLTLPLFYCILIYFVTYFPITFQSDLTTLVGPTGPVVHVFDTSDLVQSLHSPNEETVAQNVEVICQSSHR